jgi:hypothetical protein
MTRRRLVAMSAVLALSFALVACDPTTETTPTPSESNEPTGSDTGTAAPGGPDPNIPYSPRPSELVPRTTGFVTETLTLPVTEDTRLLVTVDSTAIKREYVGSYRAMSVWVTYENPGDEPWSGVPAEDATISDEAGSVFEPIPDPPASDLHPDPARYDASNRDLTEPTTIGPGKRIRGVIVFHPTGGNRFITISISMDGGNVWGEWDTTMGPF